MLVIPGSEEPLSAGVAADGLRNSFFVVSVPETNLRFDVLYRLSGGRACEPPCLLSFDDTLSGGEVSFLYLIDDLAEL